MYEMQKLEVEVEKQGLGDGRTMFGQGSFDFENASLGEAFSTLRMQEIEFREG
jgi:hypothetical protein